jgi:hypothetical protein
MDLKNMPEYDFINNLTKPDVYQNQLNTIKSQMPLILNDFKKYYVFYNKNTSLNEYQQLYDNIKNNLQSLSSQLFVINNNIQSNTESINKELLVINNELNNEKNKNLKYKNIFGMLDSQYNASDEMINDYKINYNMYYLNNTALLVGILFSTFVIYKVYKPSK